MAVRQAVFVDEQQVPWQLELDGEDFRARHWLATVDGRPVGTVRLLPDGHLGRMAVVADRRRQGIGRRLLDTVLASARRDNRREVYLHAQLTARAFYARAGFQAYGDEFMDAGLPHQAMRLVLRRHRLLGVDHGKHRVDDLAATVLDMARQARRQLRIFSHSLEPALFDSPAMADALSALVRAYRNNQVQLLVVDSQPVVRSPHHLLALHRRLSSDIRFRRLRRGEEPPADFGLVADGCGLVVYAADGRQAAWADYNNVPLARDWISHFDGCWQRAIDDPEFRQLNV